MRSLRRWLYVSSLAVAGLGLARTAPRAPAPSRRPVLPMMAPVVVEAPTRVQLRADTLTRMLMRKHVDSATAARWAHEFVHYGAELHVNPKLLAAIAYAESEFKSTAYSPAGAVGLMQVVPSRSSWGEYEGRCGRMTARNLRDPHTNICFGSHIYRWFLTHHEGDTDRALSAYNNGTGEPNGYAERVYTSLAALRH